MLSISSTTSGKYDLGKVAQKLREAVVRIVDTTVIIAQNTSNKIKNMKLQITARVSKESDGLYTAEKTGEFDHGILPIIKLFSWGRKKHLPTQITI